MHDDATEMNEWPGEFCTRTTEPSKYCDMCFAEESGVTGSAEVLMKRRGVLVFVFLKPVESFFVSRLFMCWDGCAKVGRCLSQGRDGF